MEYYIFVSNNCNLKCEYCSVLLNPENANIPVNPIYSVEKLFGFISKTQIKYNDPIADIVFFGGEPTLNYGFIEKIINYQKMNLPKEYEFKYMLHTNGLLLAKIPDTVLENINSIMLSINYDKVPHADLYTGYFKEIINSIQYVRHKRYIPIIARLTITENTSLFSAISLFHPFFDAVYWQIENKANFNCYSKFYDSYGYELELTFELWLKYLRKGVLLPFIPFISAVFLSTNDVTTSAFCCGYNSSMIYIQTNGNCFTCAEDMTTKKNLIGDISDEINFESFSPQDTICKECVYLKICMGRCGRMHKEFEIDHVKEYCSLNQILFKLVDKHLNEIEDCCKDNNVSINLDNPIYHYTEYTP